MPCYARIYRWPEYRETLAFKNTYYNPRCIDENYGNNNSTVKHFRTGSFNLLSFGDVESHLISARLRRCSILRRETDVMILAHHGANNGFTNKKLLNHLEPSLTICSSNYDNQYEHPDAEIRKLLNDQNIRLMTTKTGDIIVKSIGDHDGMVRAINLKSGSTEVSSQFDFLSKKKKIVSHNTDSIRNLYAGKPRYLKL